MCGEKLGDVRQEQRRPRDSDLMQTAKYVLTYESEVIEMSVHDRNSSCIAVG